MRPGKIVSGGQTGADRAGLDVALALGIPHGGACPRGRLAEDGRIPDRYALTETASAEYHVRTERNVREADATVVFTLGPPTGGSALTLDFARKHRKPVLPIDLADVRDADVVATLRAWLATHRPRVLNVAGARESTCPGIGESVRRVLAAALGG